MGVPIGGATGRSRRPIRQALRIGQESVAGYLEGGLVSWIEAGIGLAVMPLTLTVMVLAAPILWMLAQRSASKP